MPKRKPKPLRCPACKAPSTLSRRQIADRVRRLIDLAAIHNDAQALEKSVSRMVDQERRPFEAGRQPEFTTLLLRAATGLRELRDAVGAELEGSALDG